MIKACMVKFKQVIINGGNGAAIWIEITKWQGFKKKRRQQRFGTEGQSIDQYNATRVLDFCGREGSCFGDMARICYNNLIKSSACLICCHDSEGATGGAAVHAWRFCSARVVLTHPCASATPLATPFWTTLILYT